MAKNVMLGSERRLFENTLSGLIPNILQNCDPNEQLTIAQGYNVAFKRLKNFMNDIDTMEPEDRVRACVLSIGEAITKAAAEPNTVLDPNEELIRKIGQRAALHNATANLTAGL